jgi:hypothetical protein
VVEEVVDTALDSLVAAGEVVAEVNVNATHPSIVGRMAAAVTFSI